MSEAIILLPARNEEEAIGEVIDRIPMDKISELGFSTRIIVVDGHSSDSTAIIAKKRGAEVLTQVGPKGKGNGVREAIDLILKNSENSNSEIVIMLDADATYYPEQIPELIEQLKENEVVWGAD